MNSITIAGPLGRDAEQRFLPTGDAVCSFSIADSQGRDKPTTWWSCSLFGKRAEALQQYLVKGQYVTVAGSVSQREYTDKNGQQVKAFDVRVNELALQGGRSQSQNSESHQDQQQRPAPRHVPATSQSAQRQAPAAPGGFEDMSDEIPFQDPLANRAYCLCV